MPTLDIEAVSDALAWESEVRAKLTSIYDLDPAGEAPAAFTAALIRAFDQAPVNDPLEGMTASSVFEAAVRALGSNSRSWSSFITREPELALLLEEYDPHRVAQAVRAGDLSAEVLRSYFTGVTGRADATAVLRWATRLEATDFQSQVRAVVDGMRAAHESDAGEPLQHGSLMPLVVAFLSAPSARAPVTRFLEVGDVQTWKLQGMGAVLGSEFFRNLGWSGFSRIDM